MPLVPLKNVLRNNSHACICEPFERTNCKLFAFVVNIFIFFCGYSTAGGLPRRCCHDANAKWNGMEAACSEMPFMCLSLISKVGICNSNDSWNWCRSISPFFHFQFYFFCTKFSRAKWDNVLAKSSHSNNSNCDCMTSVDCHQRRQRDV